jgi:hypothetical protein
LLRVKGNKNSEVGHADDSRVWGVNVRLSFLLSFFLEEIAHRSVEKGIHYQNSKGRGGNSSWRESEFLRQKHFV